MRFFRFLALVFPVLLAVSPPARGAESRCVLDQLVAPLQQKADSGARMLKGLEKQYQGMNQTAFPTEAERANYEERKKELLLKIQEKKKELEKLAKELMFLRQKRALFPKSLNASRCDFYCAATVDPAAWEAEADRVQRTFERIFPSTSISFAVRPQVFVYGDPEQYIACEAGDLSAMCYSRKQVCEMGVMGAPSPPANPRQTVLALVAGKGADGFRHMLAHAHVEELANAARSPTAVRASALVREGFVENIASTANDRIYEARAGALLKNLPVPPPDDPLYLSNLLDREAPPQENEVQVQNFYGEGAVFVRWASTLQNGFQLLRQLLTARPGEIETLIRNHQAARGMDRIGFEEYLAWRNGEMERIKAKTLVPAAGGPSPAPVASTNAPPTPR